MKIAYLRAINMYLYKCTLLTSHTNKYTNNISNQ